ncbi:MAG: YjfB family protein [Spirochaetales bacterium]|nr:YjfB family protein [Spirochaetales bacterium]
MNIESITAMSTAALQEQASISILKQSMDSSQQAVLKLLEGMEMIQDPALGQHIDTTA